MARFLPPEGGMGGEGEAASDTVIEPGALLQAKEAFLCPFSGQELPVALVDIAGYQLRAFGIGAGDKDGRNTADVCRKPRRVEVADCRLGRNEHLAAEVPALLLRSQLVLEMHARDTRLDIAFHDL